MDFQNETREEYRAIILCVGENGELLGPGIIETLKMGQRYSLKTPKIPGMKPDRRKLEGVANRIRQKHVVIYRKAS